MHVRELVPRRRRQLVSFSPSLEGRRTDDHAMSRRSSPKPTCKPAASRRKCEQHLHDFFVMVDAGPDGESLARGFKRCAVRVPRRCRLSTPSLWRLFRVWKRGGQTPEALRRRPNKGLVSSLPAPMLCRFVQFCATLRRPSLKAALADFMKRGGVFGSGRRGKKRLRITYGMVQFYFSGANFRQLQSAQEAIEAARRELAALRLRFEAEIRQRLPDVPRRRRRTGAELSLGASEL